MYVWRNVDKEEKEIPLPNVTTDVLNKVIAFLKYNADCPMKEIGASPSSFPPPSHNLNRFPA